MPHDWNGAGCSLVCAIVSSVGHPREARSSVEPLAFASSVEPLASSVECRAACEACCRMRRGLCMPSIVDNGTQRTWERGVRRMFIRDATAHGQTRGQTRGKTHGKTHEGCVHLCACSRGFLPACEWLRVAVRMGWFQPAAAPAWRRQKKDSCWPT